VQLPALESDDAVTTSTTEYFVAMPTDYQRKLYACYSETYLVWIPVYESLVDLERRFTNILNQTGRVVAVAPMGDYLVYQRCPSSPETLHVFYMAKPTVITSSSTPSELPESLSRPLLTNYCLKEIFSIKSLRDEKFQKFADLYTQNFNENMAALKNLIGPERRPAITPPDEMGLDSLY